MSIQIEGSYSDRLNTYITEYKTKWQERKVEKIFLNEFKENVNRIESAVYDLVQEIEKQRETLQDGENLCADYQSLSQAVSVVEDARSKGVKEYKKGFFRDLLYSIVSKIFKNTIYVGVQEALPVDVERFHLRIRKTITEILESQFGGGRTVGKYSLSASLSEDGDTIHVSARKEEEWPHEIRISLSEKGLEAKGRDATVQGDSWNSIIDQIGRNILPKGVVTIVQTSSEEVSPYKEEDVSNVEMSGVVESLDVRVDQDKQRESINYQWLEDQKTYYIEKESRGVVGGLFARAFGVKRQWYNLCVLDHTGEICKSEIRIQDDGSYDLDLEENVKPWKEASRIARRNENHAGPVLRFLDTRSLVYDQKEVQENKKDFGAILKAGELVLRPLKEDGKYWLELYGSSFLTERSTIPIDIHSEPGTLKINGEIVSSFDDESIKKAAANSLKLDFSKIRMFSECGGVLQGIPAFVAEAKSLCSTEKGSIVQQKAFRRMCSGLGVHAKNAYFPFVQEGQLRVLVFDGNKEEELVGDLLKTLGKISVEGKTYSSIAQMIRSRHLQYSPSQIRQLHKFVHNAKIECSSKGFGNKEFLEGVQEENVGYYWAFRDSTAPKGMWGTLGSWAVGRNPAQYGLAIFSGKKTKEYPLEFVVTDEGWKYKIQQKLCSTLSEVAETCQLFPNQSLVKIKERIQMRDELFAQLRKLPACISGFVNVDVVGQVKRASEVVDESRVGVFWEHEKDRFFIVSALAGKDEIFNRISVDTSSEKPVYLFLGKRYLDLDALKEAYVPNFLDDILRKEEWENVPGNVAPRRLEESQGFEVPEPEVMEVDEESELDEEHVLIRRRHGEKKPVQFVRPNWIRRAGTTFIKEDFAREIGELLGKIESEEPPSIFSCLSTHAFNTEQKAFQAMLRAVGSWGYDSGIQERARECVRNLSLFERFCLLEMAVKTNFLLKGEMLGVQRFLLETLNTDRGSWETLDVYIEDNYSRYGQNGNSTEEAIAWLESFIK